MIAINDLFEQMASVFDMPNARTNSSRMIQQLEHNIKENQPSKAELGGGSSGSPAASSIDEDL
jgi:hypothetical protein